MRQPLDRLRGNGVDDQLVTDLMRRKRRRRETLWQLSKYSKAGAGHTGFD
jgi:hypothetical protein